MANYGCCDVVEGGGHAENCPAVAEVRRQDAEYRAGVVAVFCEHDDDIPCSTIGCVGRSRMDVILSEEG